MKIELDLSRYTSVRIGTKAMVRVLQEVSELESGEVLIGAGCNLLVSSTPPLLAILSDKFSYIKQDGLLVEIGAAYSAARIYHFCKMQNLGGLEFLRNIPGQLGGLVFMNAGLCGLSISDSLLEILTPRGWVGKDEFSFSYRHSGINEPIFAARFLLKDGFDQVLAKSLSSKRKSQPKGASFGSCFKNPPGDFAGRLIELVGLKGHVIGGAMFSQAHANFLINFNKASFGDAICLLDLAKTRVYESFGVELQSEVCILDSNCNKN